MATYVICHPQMLSAMSLCYLPIGSLAKPFRETSDQETRLVHFHRVCTLHLKISFVFYLVVSQQYIHTVSNALQMPCKWNNFSHLFVAWNNMGRDERAPAACRMALDMRRSLCMYLRTLLRYPRSRRETRCHVNVTMLVCHSCGHVTFFPFSLLVLTDGLITRSRCRR